VSFGEVMVSAIRMPVDCLVTDTPWRFTSSGSRGVARATRFCTLIWARSASVPTLNVTVSA
jgi:hypothetical protein